MTNKEENKRFADDAAEVARKADAWLKSAKLINDAVPFVQKTFRTSEHLSIVFTKAPDTFHSGHFQQIDAALSETTKLLDSDGFRLPVNVLPAAITGSASVTAAANYAVVDLSAARLEGDRDAQVWVMQYLPPLQNLQLEDSNVAFIRRKLETLRSGSEREFNQSLSDYHKCRAENLPATAAGASLRNVLETSVVCD